MADSVPSAERRSRACHWGWRAAGSAAASRPSHVGDGAHGLTAMELERRLLELGFVEGAEVEVLHEGPLGGDPIAVRVNDTTIALRRREAMAILVI